MKAAPIETAISYCEDNTIEHFTIASPQYDNVRLVYNRMHDLRPALIVRTINHNHLRNLLAIVANTNIDIAIRGGGHHIAGFSSCNDGIVFDFSPFNSIEINEKFEITVEPGARLRDVDEFLSSHLRSLPTGTVSDTGIAGLTLGGGIGWQIGTLGLTCDNLISAEVLTANGEVIIATESKNSELLWALRGGGGNFGIVLKFTYRTFPLPKFTVGTAEVDSSHFRSTLQTLCAYLSNHCPQELTVAPVFLASPDSKEVRLLIDFCITETDRTSADTLRELQEVIGDAHYTIQEDADFVDWQSITDHLFLPPKRGYWKCQYFNQLSLETIDLLISHIQSNPSNLKCSILLEHLHGEVFRKPELPGAFPMRDKTFGVLFSARWDDPVSDEAGSTWVRSGFYALPKDEKESYAYSNYTFEEDGKHAAVYDSRSELATKLREIKTKYDPENIFHRNHNIEPLETNLSGG
jgi:hypothetical protein